MSYNGWTNWETWNVNLWIDNEEPLYSAKVSFLMSSTGFDADSVEEFCKELFPYGTPDMQGDEKETVAEQWAKVNWEEIAEHFELEAEEYE